MSRAQNDAFRLNCCEECFRVDWNTHKKKHNEFANERTDILEFRQGVPIVKEVSTKKYRKDLKKITKDGQKSYHNTMSLISSAMMVMDYNRAETLCKKAIEEFPSYPEPYHHMAHILRGQKEWNDAMRFTAVSIEKICRLLLNVEKKMDGSADQFLSHSWQRKAFLCEMSNMFHMQKNVESANIVEWVENDKKFLSIWSYYFEIIKDKNSFDRFKIDRDVKLLDPETIASLLQARRTKTHQEVDHNSSFSPYFDGEWVIAHGLKSSIGKKLNHGVAMVKGDDLNEEGRVSVVFKQDGPIKHLKVENLKRARTVNAKAALLMFLDESEQWEFMMNDFLTK